MRLRVDGRPFSLEGREYVRQIIRDYSPEIWCPKAAQMAYTVTAIVRSLHNVTERKWNGLYLLPLKTGAIPFVQARIDPIIESNPLLNAKFGSVDNRLHKQSVDKLNLYIRGTNISRELQEVPVDFEVWDERDRMVDENLEDARHRMDGSKIKHLLVLSTPTVDGHGVYADDAWPVTDKHRWEIPCPGCGRFQSLNFDDPELDYSNVRLGVDEYDCVVECAFCHKEILDDVRMHELNALGRWSAHNLDGRLRGYYINQLNSPTQKLHEIMSGFFGGQTEIKKLKAFWQQNMGKPYTAPGDRITPQLLDRCRAKGYHLGTVPSSSLFIGIDVGTVIHVWAWMMARGKKYLWKIEIFDSWDKLDSFLGQLVSWTGVIDAHPEKAKARELALKYHGRLYIGFEQDRDQQAEVAQFDQVRYREAPEVKIDRTLAFDQVIGDFLNGSSWLPMEARDMGEHMPQKDFNGLYYQLTQQVRVEVEKPITNAAIIRSQTGAAVGGVIARWIKNKNKDHWHHACMFATIATMGKQILQVPSALSGGLGRGGIVG